MAEQIICVIDGSRHICAFDFGSPERLEGARMQYMVTDETPPLGACLAYFTDEADAVAFARWKARQKGGD